MSLPDQMGTLRLLPVREDDSALLQCDDNVLERRASTNRVNETCVAAGVEV